MATATKRGIYIEARSIGDKPLNNVVGQDRNVVGRGKTERIRRRAYGPVGGSGSTARGPLSIGRHLDCLGNHGGLLVAELAHDTLNKTLVRVCLGVVFCLKDGGVPNFYGVDGADDDDFLARQIGMVDMGTR